MTRLTALLDANILYPAPTRDIFLQLAVDDVFRAKWTSDIHREWIAALLRNEPHRERAALERTRDFMNQATRDCLVAGYETLVSSLELPDPPRPTRSCRGHSRTLRRDRHIEPSGLSGNSGHAFRDRSPTPRRRQKDTGASGGAVPQRSRLSCHPRRTRTCSHCRRTLTVFGAALIGPFRRPRFGGAGRTTAAPPPYALFVGNGLRSTSSIWRRARRSMHSALASPAAGSSHRLTSSEGSFSRS